MSIKKGILYVVGSPIGNLQDFSPRAQAILRQVDWIAAEDTRHSRKLLTHFNIDTPMQSLHEHNEHQFTVTLLEDLHMGKSVALLSDAGTPLISDPGSFLVQTAHAQGITVIPIPGACALTTALSVAGLPADRFVFEGFLPPKSTARQHRLVELVKESRTLVFYEAPHRILDCLQDLIAIFGNDRTAVLGKELTKLFEQVYRDTLAGIYAWLTAQPERQQGEFVLVVQGVPFQVADKTINPEVAQIFNVLRQELPLKQAAKLTSILTGVSKNTLYTFGLESDRHLNECE
ncbi:MAG: 16S rRNA (cytidine(1402)-2'-O)-methyltransferase [Beggiatoa sp. IS2]|nr:MAG: 16S rRNA (cytidine(1402)-2'-O)-methyltransferase [Beggiatoa sp. IS2]